MTRDYHINVFYSDADGGYIADIPDLDACSAFGPTPQAALAEVLAAKDAWLARGTGAWCRDPTTALSTRALRVGDRTREPRGIRGSLMALAAKKSGPSLSLDSSDEPDRRVIRARAVCRVHRRSR
ncbi:hypothetical protein BH23ACT10_BH23ACT10_30350 [soil metagenome]